MKRVYILGFLLGWSLTAHAELTLVGTASTISGGTLGLFKDVDECNSRAGVLLKLPFTEGIPGCVTSLTGTSMHVFYKTGLEMDYDISIWTPVTPVKTTAKGAL